MKRHAALLPFLAVVAGIGVFSLMDAAMKSASMLTGAYTAVMLRNWLGTVLALPAWAVWQRRKIAGNVMRIHALRGGIVALMAPLFFEGLTRIPMAEGIALSFIAPLVALYLASLMLDERIRPSAIVASLMGLAGVAVIAAGRFGEGGFEPDALVGIAAILASAMAYAVNLVLQRRQALLAPPLEIAAFQNLFVGLALLPLAPWLATAPEPAALRDIALGAVLATIALLLLSWGYARAEAQVLLPIEYTAFLWAALFGWLWFGETVNPSVVAGAVLIVAGCLMTTRRPGAVLEA